MCDKEMLKKIAKLKLIYEKYEVQPRDVAILIQRLDRLEYVASPYFADVLRAVADVIED